MIVLEMLFPKSVIVKVHHKNTPVVGTIVIVPVPVFHITHPELLSEEQSPDPPRFTDIPLPAVSIANEFSSTSRT